MFTKSDNTIYRVSDIDTVCSAISADMVLVRGNNKTHYFNVPCAFDIETTSFYENEEKVGMMYVWQFGINGRVFIGRTWEDFIELINGLIEHFYLTQTRRLVVYVHNLAFEFQFIRTHFKWLEVFSSETRKPIYALTANGIEFRCSYILSGYSLEKVGEHLVKYPCEKLIGELDYSLKRHNKTPLTDTELQYCFNDVMVLMCYVQETIENDGNISRIPLTKTGYVRNYCREMCMFESKNHRKGGKKFDTFHKLIKNLSIDYDEYLQLKRAFMGGFTHSNAINTGKVLHNVKSFDFTSSYPYCMLSEMYPMSRGRVIDNVDEINIDEYCKLYCCVFDVQITNLTPSINYENYISQSKCFKCVNPVINNGRVVCADLIWTTITNVDYDIIKRCYTWDKLEIANFRIYQKDYLPTPFIKSIIKLYQDKTKLKGVDGKEVEYLRSKEMLNSCYGMTVTDIARDEIVYDNNWSITKSTKEHIISELERYNKSKKRFLFYPWGVFVTAYARRNLFTGIMEFKNDYIYSDTDSIKVINHERHMEYIERYNALTQRKLQTACDYHGIDIAELQPKTIRGVTKLLGIWDNDGDYECFKTLGAKRYMYQARGKYHITIAGTNKTKGGEYMATLKFPFKVFNEGLIIPKEYTGKLTHTYIDTVKEGILIDYLGNAMEYKTETGIHLEPCEYNLSLASQYIDFLEGVKETWK